jgi:DNA-binding beta-propeller fold protein YncE
VRPLLALAIFLAIGLVAACSSSTAPPSTPTAAATATTAATSTTAASAAPSDGGIPLADRLEAEIAVEGSPDWPLAAFNSMWVLAPDLPLIDDAATPNLVRIDPATNEVVATIALPDRLCQGFTASEDAIWACAVDGLVRVDPATNAITDTVPVMGAQGGYRPAAGGGYLWFLGSGGSVADTVIALDTGAMSTRTFQQSGTVGGMAYAFDSLWLTIPGEGAVVQFDPVTEESEVITTDLPNPKGIVAGADSLWVSLHGANDDSAAAGDTQLVRIDPESGEVTAEFAIGGSPQWGVEAWAGDEAIHVRSTTPWMVTIDPATNEIVETITSQEAVQGPLTVAFDSIWTVNLEHENVFRLTP